MATEVMTAGIGSAAQVMRAPGTAAGRASGRIEVPAQTRGEVRPGTAGTNPSRTTLCRCGHDAEAHEHYRSGSDCGACGAERCGRFRAQGRRRLWPWRRA